MPTRPTTRCSDSNSATAASNRRSSPETGARVSGAATPKAVIAATLLCLALAAATRAEVIRKGNLQVSYGGKIAPYNLPRVGTAPVAVSISAQKRTTDHQPPPQLRRIE